MQVSKELAKNIAEDRKSGGHEKTGNRNEAVFLLDGLKRQGGISRRMYRQYNNFLAESLPVGFGIVDEAVDEDVEEMDTSNKDEEEEEEEEELSSEDDLKKEIASTIDYLIEHDKKELLESVKELQRDEEIIDTVTELEELIAMYLEDEFLDRESLAEKVHERLDKLSKSKHVQKSLLLKIKMLVNDIAKNRVRVRGVSIKLVTLAGVVYGSLNN